MAYFKSDFEARLNRLYYCLGRYFSTGRPGSLIPAIFSCVRYLWCNSDYRNKRYKFPYV